MAAAFLQFSSPLSTGNLNYNSPLLADDQGNNGKTGFIPHTKTVSVTVEGAMHTVIIVVSVVFALVDLRLFVAHCSIALGRLPKSSARTRPLPAQESNPTIDVEI